MKKYLFTLVLLLSAISLYAEPLKLLHEKTFNVNPGEKLYLQTESGDINITSWDKNEVKVKILGNSKAERKMEFTMEKKDKEVYISGEKKGGNIFNWFSNVSIRYEIVVPIEFFLELKTSGGDISIKKVNGLKKLRTSGGDIDLIDISGEANASTSGGDITADNKKGELNVSTSGGDIIIKSQSGKISASTSGGDVKLEYYGENEGVDLSTSGGDIEVYLQSGFKANAELKTSGGDISIAFPTTSTDKMSSSKSPIFIMNRNTQIIDWIQF
ncbi:MAG: DUF4097 family beta strand repeat-containing protein [bacterium]